MANSSSSGGGIGFVGLLSVAFIVLKLVHAVTWSWLWVLSPIWIGWSAFLVFVVFCLPMHSISKRSK